MELIAASTNRLLHQPRRLFVVIFALTSLLTSTWSIAQPLFVGPDEPAQVIWAYSLDHATAQGATTQLHAAFENVKVPASLAASQENENCFLTVNSQPANCAKPIGNDTHLVGAQTHFSQYPPLYYGLVGVSTFFMHGSGSVYLMRIFSALLTSLMLSIALFAAIQWSTNRWLRFGVIAAASPQVLFLGSIVNPSGLEVSSALALYTVLFLLLTEEGGRNNIRAQQTLFCLAGVFALARPLSLMYLGIAGALGVLCFGFKPTVVFWKSSRTVRRGVIFASLSAVIAALWILTHKSFKAIPSTSLSLVTPGESTGQLLRWVFKFVGGWFHETIGFFGWLDTMMPLRYYQLYEVVLVIGFALALVVSNWRFRLGLLSLAILTYFLPVAIVMLHVRHLGVVWQGRDELPLVVGLWIFVLGSIGFTGHVPNLQRTARGALALFFGLSYLFTFYEVLRRYSVGLHGSRFFFLHGALWHPPVPILALLIVNGLILLTLGTVVVTKDPAALSPQDVA